jgi:ATP-dependent exoDNAse (exonuclease V) alpha subunit
VSERRIEVLVAAAGTGKTTTLAAARDAWDASGIPIVGAALAARAAGELEQTAGIPSTTIATLLAGSGPAIPARGVVVIDEAGMVGTRQLFELIRRTNGARSRLILVGDPHQLPEIAAGGLFRRITDVLPALTLTTNRRQHEAWERAALHELRVGDPATALRAYQAHGRITVHAEHADTRAQLVTDWAAARADGEAAIMLASRKSDVAALNALARHAIAETGQLRGAPLAIEERNYRIGDEIICLRNNRGLGLTNGTRGHITEIDRRAKQLEIVTTERQRHTIPFRYVEAGHVNHAYALTIHKAQGLTTENVYALIGDDAYRELAYTALSRGRTTNRIYATLPNGSEHRTDLDDALRTSRVQRLASDHRPQTEADFEIGT